mmetsp:Transcript_10156/g.29141  ORF Transcript_10156/g.29141 Transcript_10156/m.29141 type:complete len:413 (-) Transcript_10156:60-1298(-)
MIVCCKKSNRQSTGSTLALLAEVALLNLPDYVNETGSTQEAAWTLRRNDDGVHPEISVSGNSVLTDFHTTISKSPKGPAFRQRSYLSSEERESEGMTGTGENIFSVPNTKSPTPHQTKHHGPSGSVVSKEASNSVEAPSLNQEHYERSGSVFSPQSKVQDEGGCIVGASTMALMYRVEMNDRATMKARNGNNGLSGEPNAVLTNSLDVRIENLENGHSHRVLGIEEVGITESEEFLAAARWERREDGAILMRLYRRKKRDSPKDRFHDALLTNLPNTVCSYAVPEQVDLYALGVVIFEYISSLVEGLPQCWPPCSLQNERTDGQGQGWSGCANWRKIIDMCCASEFERRRRPSEVAAFLNSNRVELALELRQCYVKDVRAASSRARLVVAKFAGRGGSSRSPALDPTMTRAP